MADSSADHETNTGTGGWGGKAAFSFTQPFVEQFTFVVPKFYKAGIYNAVSRRFHHLNSLLSFFRTLVEPRQAEIRKECLQLWGVSKVSGRQTVKVSFL